MKRSITVGIFMLLGLLLSVVIVFLIGDKRNFWTGKVTYQASFADVAGLKPGRESDEETNLFWHRGLSLSDIALGAFMLEKAKRMGLGQKLRFR